MGGGTVGWNEGDHLALAAQRAGLNLEEMEAEIAKSADNYDAEIEANQEALAKDQHWGVPTFSYNKEPFFGQDRIDSLRYQLEKDGLKRVLTN